MRVVGALLAGLVAGVVLLVLLDGVLRSPALRRANHRGAAVPTAAGLAAVAAVLVVEAVWSLVDGPSAARTPVVLVVAGYGFLGLLDDVVGSGGDGRGFRGHLRALRTGRLTTGGLKLLAGTALGVVAGAMVVPDRPGRALLGGAVIALAANLANLLDRAPGRTLKVALLVGVVLAAAARLDGRLTGVAVALGASLALLGGDLRERLMLGDTGANALGAALGVGVVLVTPVWGQVAVLVVLLALNAASERFSFGAVIDRVGPLRWVDRAGRPRGYPEVP